MMSKRLLWKTIQFHQSWQMDRFESYWKSSYNAFGYTYGHKRHTMEITKYPGGGEIETNLPIKALRQLFSYTGIPWPRDILWDSKPSWEYDDDEW